MDVVASVNKPLKARFQGLEIRAPEIWKKPYSSPACDVWSLGVTVRISYLHDIFQTITDSCS